KEEEHLKKREHALISRNAALGGSADGFRHMGVAYCDLTGAARSRANLPRLHSSLVGELDAIRDERKTLAYEKDRTRQALAMVLKDCVDWQDIRDALPNGLEGFLPETKSLERTREEAFTLKDDPRAHDQYMRLKDK